MKEPHFMYKISLRAFQLGLLALLLGAWTFRFLETPPSAPYAVAADSPAKNAKRIPWTTSRLTGSPDPPHPYKVERAFPKLTFKNPLLLTMAPVGNRFFVGEQAGKIYSFPNDPLCSKADLFLDV